MENASTEGDTDRHATAQRPKSFDDKVLAYIPALNRLASRMEKNPSNRQDLVNDTIVSSLQRWQSFREDGAMYSWLRFTMRGIYNNGIRMRSTRMEKMSTMSFSDVVAPNQEECVDLSKALDRLSTVKNGDLLIKYAVGNDSNEIAHDLGISGTAVRKKMADARFALHSPRTARIAANA